ncbi:DNA-binding domain-containing protein [Listeria monocytogenes]|nr:DNA-binding domain-containing protein [Listeria monocytogenes]
MQVEDIPKNKPGRKRKTQKNTKKKKPIFSAKLCLLNSKHQRPSKNKSATTNHAKKPG